MEDLIADPTKFEKLHVKEGKDYNFMIKEKKIVDELLTELLEKQSINGYTKERLTPDGPNPARLYGLPKIHKDLVNGLPKFRPIISQIGSSTYKLAKFLLPFITPVVSNKYTLSDSFKFISMLDNQNHRYYMASLDIDSLFTNIPLSETIEIIIKQIYDKNRKIQGISKKDFRRMLELATKGTVFYFNGSYFRQIDGVAMGSPLGPHLANAFLCYYEQIWIDNCPLLFAPMLYVRYVDDIFVLLRSRENLSRLVDYFNLKHPNIHFTWEEEKDNRLSFLDISVYRDTDGFVTSIHRKNTFSGIYTNYMSFISDKYKHSLVSTLLYRAYMISSSYQILHEEIVKLKEVLKSNSYPKAKLDNIIFRFFDKISNPPIPVTTVPKKVVRIILPFLGSASLNIKKKLNQSFRHALPMCSLQVVFKTQNRMSSWFSFKDMIPKSLLSGVIYEYKCPRCKSGYRGSTFRYWEKRLEEHLHLSALTGYALKGMQVFPPLEHSRKCAPINRDQFTIIGKERDRNLLRIKESIFIRETLPSLNGMDSSAKLYLF